MEQPNILSAWTRPIGITVDHVRDRMARAAGSSRSDHDLNPGVPRVERLRPAAVLVPIIDYGVDDLTILLTQRTQHLAAHAGQISFPGGRIEADDATPRHAALRETAEEVGIDPDRVDVLGQLASYVTVTGFHVTPIVGVIKAPADPVPDPYEVAEVFEVPLSFFLTPSSRQLHTKTLGGAERRYWVYPYEDRYIWGATAGMLNNFVSVLKGIPTQ